MLVKVSVIAGESHPVQMINRCLYVRRYRKSPGLGLAGWKSLDTAHFFLTVSQFDKRADNGSDTQSSQEVAHILAPTQIKVQDKVHLYGCVPPTPPGASYRAKEEQVHTW